MLSEKILTLPNKNKKTNKQQLKNNNSTISTILDELQSCISPHKLPKSINEFLKLNAQTHSYNVYRDSDAPASPVVILYHQLSNLYFHIARIMS